MINYRSCTFSTRNRNIRISCPFSCYYLMWQHRILIHSQSGLIIGGYWGFMALGHMKPNQNPVVWKLKATCSESPGQCDNVTKPLRCPKKCGLIIYLHVSPRISTYLHVSPHVHLTFRRIMERQPAPSASTLPIPEAALSHRWIIHFDSKHGSIR